MNVENKKVSVLEQVRDRKAVAASKRFGGGDSVIRGTYQEAWDAAIDLLPVLFAEFIVTKNLIQAGNFLYYNDLTWNAAELYTYWKENILTKEDLVL